MTEHCVKYVVYGLGLTESTPFWSYYKLFPEIMDSFAKYREKILEVLKYSIVISNKLPLLYIGGPI